MHTTNGGSLHLRGFARPRLLSLIGLLLLMLGVLTATPTTANASPGWELILDRPTPSFKGMDFVSADEGWLVAGAGLLHTTDGGATWEEQAKLSGSDVDFADASHGWLVGQSGSIHATTDGGATWVEQASGTSVHLTEVAAVSPGEAFVIGSGAGFGDVFPVPILKAFLYTADGGETWEEVETAPGNQIDDLVVADGRIWAAGSVCANAGEANCTGTTNPLLLFSSDGGTAWTKSEGVPDRLTNLAFADADHGWGTRQVCAEVGQCVNEILRTGDGGLSWEATDITAQGRAISVSFANSEQGWALVRNFEAGFSLLSTSNGGLSWEFRADVPTGSTPFLRHLHRQGTALYAIGSEIALRSTDDGASWRRMKHPALYLQAVKFADPEVGFATGSPRGTLLKTEDAGANWEPVPGAPSSVRALAFLNRDTGFALSSPCCDGPPLLEIYRTADSGRSWELVHSSNTFDSRSAHDAEFVDAQHGWFALGEGFFLTEDGGQTWHEEPAGPWLFVIDADFAGPGIAWVIVSPASFEERGSRLFRTEDGGRTWEQVTSLPTEGSLEGPRRIEFVDGDHGWSIMTRCNDDSCEQVVHQTSDGGLTWREHPQPFGGFLYDFYFVDADHGWMSAQGCLCRNGTSGILHSADGGGQWHEQVLDASNPEEALFLGTFDFVDSETGWFLLSASRAIPFEVGPPNRTRLYHTIDGGGVSVPTPTVHLPKVGAATPSDSSNLPSFALVVSGLALSLGAAGIAAARHARRP